MNKFSSLLLAFAVILYCSWHSFGLVDVWLGAPWELYSWVSFFIWLVPIPIFWIFYPFSKRTFNWNSFPIWMALLMTLLGQMGSLNTFKYLGLAFALSALIPWRWMLFFWVIGSMSWMPALGWFGSYYFPTILFSARIAIATVATSWAIFITWRKL